jgi:hypothetical protein
VQVSDLITYVLKAQHCWAFPFKEFVLRINGGFTGSIEIVAQRAPQFGLGGVLSELEWYDVRLLDVVGIKRAYGCPSNAS